MARLESRADTKAAIVVSVTAALGAGAGALMVGLVAHAQRWGWWLTLAALPVGVAILLLVNCVVHVLRQVQPVIGAQLFGTPERIAELDVMDAASWYREKLESGGPIITEKFRVIGAAVSITYGAVFLLFLGGGAAWLLMLLRVGQ